MDTLTKDTPKCCRISITLADDDEFGHTTRTYHPGDLLHGHVHIDYDDGVVVEVAVLTLEGTMRNWVDHETSASAVKHDFLRQSQQLPRQQQQDIRRTKTGTCWTMPFKFRIASRCFPNDGLSSQMSLLPPSLAAGQISIDQQGNRCMQPLIAYGIHAVVAHRSRSRRLCRQSQHFRGIDLVPWTEAAPPCSTDDFPGEFIPVCTADLRRRLARTSRGEITLSMSEPKPLAIFAGDAQTRKASTEGLLRLLLQSSELLVGHAQLPRWTCAVKTQVVKKTYYSTMPLREAANTRLLKANKYVQLRTEVIQSASWKVDPLCWNREPASETRSRTSCSATVPVPIECKTRLVPTFCSSLAAVRYSIRVTLRVVGLHHDELAVEVPLQVYHCRKSQQRDDPPPIDAMWETATSLPQVSGATRAIDEVLEIEPPPSYYA